MSRAAPGAWRRVSAATLARVSFAVLVLATFLAIFYAQELKRQAPLLFSPTGGVIRFQPRGTITTAHVTHFAHFKVKASVGDILVVSIVDARSGRTVRTYTVPVHEYSHRSVSWDGLTTAGRPAPAGSYRVRVHFRAQGSTVEPALVLVLLGGAG